MKKTRKKETNEASNGGKAKYVLAEEKVDKFGHRVLVEPGTDYILSVFTNEPGVPIYDIPMKNQQKPKATQKEIDKLAILEDKVKNYDYSDPNAVSPEMDLLNLMNSYRWYPEIVNDGDKCGIASVLGKVILPTEFEDVKFFNFAVEEQSVITAKKEGKWGLVKTYSGESVTGFIYDYMPPVSGNITPVMKDEKWGYIKNNGESFTPLDLETVFIENGATFMNGISVFKKDGRYGVTDGYDISKPVFDEIDMVELDSSITGTRDGVKGYINEEGEFTTNEDEAYWAGDNS